MSGQERFRDYSESDFTADFHEFEAADFDRRAEEARAEGDTEEADRLDEQARLAKGRFRRAQTVDQFHTIRGHEDPDKA